jgi:formylglycine-generating enzyme required for sulfatase activity
MTNNEWMTIARNVETVPANWCDKNGTNCGFTPGTKGKILANGHNDNSSVALVAGNDNQPCFGTTTDGSNQCGGPSSQKRTLTLTNGEVIWDLAGNVWQWVDAIILRQDQPQSFTNGILDQGWIWSEFAPGAKATVITHSDQGPSDLIWNSANGIGRIYHYSGVPDHNTTAYTFIRGGNWRHGYDSGAFTVHMSPVADKENIDDVGFRCTADLK